MAYEEFYFDAPSLEDYWRSIILFGRNVATYKFALAKSLLDLRPESGQLIKLSDLAPTFALHLAEHIKVADKQATSVSSKFLDACRQYNIDKELSPLVDVAVSRGFANVIEAFHVVGQENIPKRFYVDERSQNGGIRITDEFSELLSGIQAKSLNQEVESRWRLVETAWEMGLSRNLLSISYDDQSKSLYSIDRSKKRQVITSSRGALNGYQKGKCFYCFCDISIDSSESLADVDHFFPHKLKQAGFGSIIDGVWNLVLSCKDCNRGVKGKFERLPSQNLLLRLFQRNEFLIASHHPLRETLLLQTGLLVSKRKEFLNHFYQKSKGLLIHEWEPKLKHPKCF